MLTNTRNVSMSPARQRWRWFLGWSYLLLAWGSLRTAISQLRVVVAQARWRHRYWTELARPCDECGRPTNGNLMGAMYGLSQARPGDLGVWCPECVRRRKELADGAKGTVSIVRGRFQKE